MIQCLQNLYKLGKIIPQFATHIHETVPMSLFTQRGEI